MSSSSSSTDLEQPSQPIIESMQMEIEQLKKRLEAIEIHPLLVDYQCEDPQMSVPTPSGPKYTILSTGSAVTVMTDVEVDMEAAASAGRARIALEITPIQLIETVRRATAPVPPVEAIAEPSAVVPAENLTTTTAEVYSNPEESAQPAPKRRCRSKMMPKMGGNIDPLAMEPEDLEDTETVETVETAKVEESSESSESIEIVHDSRSPAKPQMTESLKRKCSVVLRKVKVPKRRVTSTAVGVPERRAPPSSIEVPEEDWELPAEPELRPRRGQTTSEIKEALEQLKEARKRKKKD